MPQRKESNVTNREMITPKQQYSVFNLLPPAAAGYGNNSNAFDGLGRIRDNIQRRRDSQDFSNNGDTNADAAQIGRETLTPGIDMVENLNRI